MQTAPTPHPDVVAASLLVQPVKFVRSAVACDSAVFKSTVRLLRNRVSEEIWAVAVRSADELPSSDAEHVDSCDVVLDNAVVHNAASDWHDHSCDSRRVNDAFNARFSRVSCC